MDNLSLSPDARVKLSAIDNRLIDLYESGVMEERTRILTEIRQVIQEKTDAGDLIAVETIQWLLDRVI